MELTSEEIETLLLVAGYEMVVRQRPQSGVYVVLLHNTKEEIHCPCYHDTVDDAYQCIWNAYLGETDDK